MFRLDRLVMFAVSASGALIVFELLETRRVWRLGELNEVFRNGTVSLAVLPREGCRDTTAVLEDLFNEEFLEVISSLSGDVARCWLLAFWPRRDAWCGDQRLGGPATGWNGVDIPSFELFARKRFGRLSLSGGLVLNDDLLLSSSSRPS